MDVFKADLATMVVVAVVVLEAVEVVVEEMTVTAVVLVEGEIHSHKRSKCLCQTNLFEVLAITQSKLLMVGATRSLAPPSSTTR